MARRPSCCAANAFSTRLKLIWLRSSLKTTKMSKKAFLAKSSRSQRLIILERVGSDQRWRILVSLCKSAKCTSLSVHGSFLYYFLLKKNCGREIVHCSVVSHVYNWNPSEAHRENFLTNQQKKNKKFSLFVFLHYFVTSSIFDSWPQVLHSWFSFRSDVLGDP